MEKHCYLKGMCLALVLCCAFFQALCALDASAEDLDELVNLRRSRNISSFGGMELRDPVSMFRDNSTGEFYLVDKELNTVFILNASLVPVFTLGAKHGIDAPVHAVSRGDRIYVAMDNKSGLAVFNYRGERLGSVKPPDGSEFFPVAMDVGPDGNIYAVSRKNGLCYVIDAADKVVRVFGMDNSGRPLSGTSGVAAGRKNIFLFTPFSGAKAIAVYDRNGEYLYGYEGILDKGGTLRMPVTGRVDAKGRLWVVDAMAGVSVYSVTGAGMENLGAFPPKGEVIDFPVSIDFDDMDVVYILENGAKRIGIFKK